MRKLNSSSRRYSVESPRRPFCPRFTGVCEIVRYNWTQYLAAVAITVFLVAALAIALSNNLPLWLTFVIAAALAGTLWFTAASLFASWWIYDVSPLRTWTWLHNLVPPGDKRWLYIHTGLDECGHLFRQEAGRGPGLILDTYSPRTMTEPSVRRARAETRHDRRPHATCRWDALPLRSASADICYLIFAAHELRRQADRQNLFHEVTRVLAPCGKLVLVEHARDLRNFLAFGPGFTHFWPASEWDKLARRAGLRCSHRGRIAGLVISRVYQKEEENDHSTT